MDPQAAASKEDVFDYYVSPSETSQRARILAEEDVRDGVAALFWKWERLRIVYNAVLFGVVLAVGFRWLVSGNEGFYVRCVVGAFFANVCYCTGFPLVIYAQRLGIDGRGILLILFTLGLLLSMGWAALVCVTYPLAF
jgi:hypothetical protein